MKQKQTLPDYKEKTLLLPRRNGKGGLSLKFLATEHQKLSKKSAESPTVLLTRPQREKQYSHFIRPVGLSWVSHSTLIYTSELILCSTICVHSATRHNIHMYPYFLVAAIHHLNRPRLSLSDLVAQSAE